MDINLLRSLVTVASLAAFLGIVWWAYGPARKERFERDALLPFLEHEDDLRTPPLQGAHRLASRCRSSGAGHGPRIPGLAPFPLSRAERGNVQRETASGPFPERENGKRS